MGYLTGLKHDNCIWHVLPIVLFWIPGTSLTLNYSSLMWFQLTQHTVHATSSCHRLQWSMIFLHTADMTQFTLASHTGSTSLYEQLPSNCIKYINSSAVLWLHLSGACLLTYNEELHLMQLNSIEVSYFYPVQKSSHIYSGYKRKRWKAVGYENAGENSYEKNQWATY